MVRGKGNVPPRIPRVPTALRSTQVEEFGVATGGGVWVAAGGVVVFLVRPEADYLSGITIDVNGASYFR
jgi:hypothetical protein